MAAPVVYKNVADDFNTESSGKLFSGKKFWVAQRVPTRNQLLGDIKANGGEIVVLEKQADYIVADHVRWNGPPGSVSYEFVEKSIQQGKLRDPKDHPAGPPLGEAREPGATHQPAKSGRVPYTADEDRILYNWVRDAEARGVSIGGNKIYQEFGEKYPRHTWQSWRDRYLKQLRHRPASAFKKPDNAPPSPPSDQSNERMPPAQSSSKPMEQHISKKGQTTIATKHDYDVDDLEILFDLEDWMELYAFAHLIDYHRGTEQYDLAWERWAENQGKNAEQWRQYFEKVVHPQWLRDPEWERKKVRQQVEKKHETEENVTQSQPVAEVFSQGSRLETEAPKSEFDECFEALISDKTAQLESSKSNVEVQGKSTKRPREDGKVEEEQEEGTEASRSIKRRKSRSATPTHGNALQTPIKMFDTQQQLLEVSSAESSQETINQEAVQGQTGLDMSEIAEDDESTMVELDEQGAYKEVESIESDVFQDPDRPPQPPPGYETNSEDELPSNTPTPRATRQKDSHYELEAILPSPTKDKFPQSFDLAEDAKLRQESLFSPSQVPGSDASTAQSIEEFRRSLQEGDLDQPSYFQHQHPPIRLSSSPAPSIASSSSTDSGDPDPPLNAEEITEFYDEENAQGFSNVFISAALKRTGLRPELAVKVLDAWKEGKPLPNERGIWSKEDDADVESGDGLALAKLHRKHTTDGWGGVTERLVFLEGYRKR